MKYDTKHYVFFFSLFHFMLWSGCIFCWINLTITGEWLWIIMSTRRYLWTSNYKIIIGFIKMEFWVWGNVWLFICQLMCAVCTCMTYEVVELNFATAVVPIYCHLHICHELISLQINAPRVSTHTQVGICSSFLVAISIESLVMLFHSVHRL